MNFLQLSLLLSLAPLGLHASSGNCCDRTGCEQWVDNKQCTDNLSILRSDDACTKECVYITIISTDASTEEWESVCNISKEIFGTDAYQTETDITFSISRDDRSLEEWFTLLRQVENKYRTLETTLISNALHAFMNIALN